MDNHGQKMMEQNWINKGLIFSPNTKVEWERSHCQLPTAIKLNENLVRVFYASRDKMQRSRVGYFDFDFDDEKVIDKSTRPILDVGAIGTFDEHGIYPSSVIKVEDTFYMYYIGWNRGIEAPLFYTSIGLAKSKDCVNFEKHYDSPILARGGCDPTLVTSPNVIADNGSFTMYYVSGVEWTRNANNKLNSRYHIKIAKSQDGIEWSRDGKVAIGFKIESETNIARASVVYFNGKYHMWYCYVSQPNSYKMGYAKSIDGISV